MSIKQKQPRAVKRDWAGDPTDKSSTKKRFARGAIGVGVVGLSYCYVKTVGALVRGVVGSALKVRKPMARFERWKVQINPSNFPAANKRRSDLINKQLIRRLNVAEALELEHLQASIRKYLKDLHPKVVSERTQRKRNAKKLKD